MTASMPVGPLAIEYRLDAAQPEAEALAPLVFLHEGLGCVGLWRGFPDAVRDGLGGPATLVYSRPGYGHSTVVTEPRSPTYMHDEALDILPAILAAVGFERPLLIGHSDGASIALIFAGAGHAVAGLALLSPHVFVEERSIQGIAAARAAYRTTDLPERLGRYHTDPDATFRGWNDIWLSPEFRSWNIEASVAGIEAPMLVVQEDGDEYGTLAQLDRIEAGVKGPTSRLVLADCGHSPQRDQEAAVIEAIAAFVTGLSQERMD